MSLSIRSSPSAMSSKQERWTTPEVERLLSLRFQDEEIAGFFSRPKTRRNRQVAWVQISERLARELPLASGAARSAAQCEQKLKNLRKEFLRVRFHQGRLERGEVVGSLRLGDYWPLLEATLGAHVEAKKRAKEPQAQPRAQEQTHRQQPAVDIHTAASNCGSVTPGSVGVKRRRDDALEASTAVDNGVEWRESEQDGESGAETTKRSQQGQQIMESVTRLNRLVSEFMGPEVDVGAPGQDLELRVNVLESEVRQLRASMSAMSANMGILLARLAESNK